MVDMFWKNEGATGFSSPLGSPESIKNVTDFADGSKDTGAGSYSRLSCSPPSIVSSSISSSTAGRPTIPDISDMSSASTSQGTPKRREEDPRGSRDGVSKSQKEERRRRSSRSPGRCPMRKSGSGNDLNSSHHAPMRKSRSGGDLTSAEKLADEKDSSNKTFMVVKKEDDLLGWKSEHTPKSPRRGRRDDVIGDRAGMRRSNGMHSSWANNSTGRLSSSSLQQTRSRSRSRGRRQKNTLSPLDQAAVAAANRTASRRARVFPEKNNNVNDQEATIKVSEFRIIMENLTKQIGELKADLESRDKREALMQEELDILRELLVLANAENNNNTKKSTDVKTGVNQLKRQVQKITAISRMAAASKRSGGGEMKKRGSLRNIFSGGDDGDSDEEQQHLAAMNKSALW